MIQPKTFRLILPSLLILTALIAVCILEEPKAFEENSEQRNKHIATDYGSSIDEVAAAKLRVNQVYVVPKQKDIIPEDVPAGYIHSLSLEEMKPLAQSFIESLNRKNLEIWASYSMLTTPEVDINVHEKELLYFLLKVSIAKQQRAVIKTIGHIHPKNIQEESKIKGSGYSLMDYRNGKPIYYVVCGLNAAITTDAYRAHNVSTFNATGSSLEIGVWDQGLIESANPEFESRVTHMETGSVDGHHATRVGGLIAAAGIDPDCLGMTPDAALHSYVFNNADVEMRAAAAGSAGESGKIYISNHSYLTGNILGLYDYDATLIDDIVYDKPYYLPVYPIGNADATPVGGSFPTCKNAVVIGSTSLGANNGIRDLSSVSIAPISLYNPPDDGRIKPDHVAPSINVYTTQYTGYATLGGGKTSYSTPCGTGSIALLIDYYSQLFGNSQAMRNASLKGLTAHTSDDLGNPGPDYTYGWGVINVTRATLLIKDFFENGLGGNNRIIEDSLSDGSDTEDTFNINWSGGSAVLKATLCWTDPSGTFQTEDNITTANLVNDLDLSIIDPNTGTHLPFAMPYVLNNFTDPADRDLNAVNAVNTRDNVEQVILNLDNNYPTGNYTVRVYTNDNLAFPNTQNYSLIISLMPIDEQWKDTYWPGITDSNIIGDNQDPDNDGKSNLMEYAFNTRPDIANADTTTVSVEDNESDKHVGLTVPMRKDESLTYTFEVSSDLIDWTTTGAVYQPNFSSVNRNTDTDTVQVNVSDNGDTWSVTERDGTAIDSNSVQRFMRVEVSK